jgi:hypothetical protein
MMQYRIRRPEWEVEIRRPDYTAKKISYKNVPEWMNVSYLASSDRVYFVSNPSKLNGVNIYDDCIGYSYANSINNPSGEFSVEFVPRLDKNGFTWKDKIKKRDMIFIKEFEKTRFIGVVKTSSYTSQMTEKGPERSITISGISLGGMIQTLELPMNTYLWDQAGSTAKSTNDSLVAALNSEVQEEQDLSKVLSQITDTFYKVVFNSQDLAGTILWFKEFTEYKIQELKTKYPQIFSVFQVGSNNLWGIYREILPSPVYEIYGTFNTDNGIKYQINTRQAPFDPEDWKELKTTIIDPVMLISQELSDSDQETYTHYYSQLTNSGFSQNENYARSDIGTVSTIDSDKIKIYGYKQMSANFKFFKSDEIDYDAKEFLKTNSDRLYDWYHNNDEFLSGTISLNNVPDKDNKMIDIGEKIKYLTGQFYVEGYKRSAKYPEKMTTILNVTRGYEYDSLGNQKQPIQKLGMRLQQAEKEAISDNIKTIRNIYA